MVVSLTGGAAHINQTGGSIFDYSTDAYGMRDRDYDRAVPLDLTFSSTANKSWPGARYQVEGKLAQLEPCPRP
jgi:hypothetical protein